MLDELGLVPSNNGSAPSDQGSAPSDHNTDDLSIVYMRQQITGKDKLLVTTLKEMGVVSGRVSLRLVMPSVPQIESIDNREELIKEEEEPMAVTTPTTDNVNTSEEMDISAVVDTIMCNISPSITTPLIVKPTVQTQITYEVSKCNNRDHTPHYSTH